MSPIILEAHDLTKEYRHTVALDHIDLQIEKGKIYGFIGQIGYRSGIPDQRHFGLMGKGFCKRFAGAEKADRLHDRNACTLSVHDSLSKYGDTTHPTRHPR